MPELAEMENANASRNELTIAKAEKVLAGEYRAAYKSISVKLAELYEKMGEPPSLVEARRFGRLEVLQKAIAAEYRKLTKRGIETTEETSTDSFLDGAYGTQWAYDQATGVAIDWPVLSDKAIKASVYEKMGGKDFEARFKKWKNEDYRKMNSRITQGLIKGDPYAKTARGLRDEINRSAFEAMRIVRTEAGRAYTQGHLKTYEEAEKAGVKARKKWVATLDTRTRDAHGELDGEYADENGLFHSDGMTAEGPRLFGDPGQDCNCRCRLVEEIEGFEPEFRRIRGEGIVEYKSFKEWATDKGWTKEGGWPKGDESIINQPSKPRITEKQRESETFIPANTLEEARQYANEMFGLKTNTAKLNLDAMNITNERLTELKKEWYVNDIAFTDETRYGVFGSASSKELSLNSKYFNNPEKFKEALIKAIETKWHPEGCDTPKSIIDHEFAHVLTQRALTYKRQGFAKNITKLKSTYTRQINKGDYSEFISRYASKNADEFVAESFAMVMNNKNPSSFAKEAVSFMKQYMGNPNEPWRPE